MLYLVFCVLKPFQNRLLAMLPGGWNSLEWTEGKNEVRDLHECPLSLCSGSAQQTQAAPLPYRDHTHFCKSSPCGRDPRVFCPTLEKGVHFLQKPLCLLKHSFSVFIPQQCLPDELSLGQRLHPSLLSAAGAVTALGGTVCASLA